MRYTRFRLPAVALLVAALFTQGHGQVAIPDPARIVLAPASQSLRVNVLDFGAKAVAGFDNAPAFQAAHDTLVQRLGTDPQRKGMLFIPSAVQPYDFLSTVYVDGGNITIDGDNGGAKLRSGVIQQSGITTLGGPILALGYRRPATIGGAYAANFASYRPDCFGKVDTSLAPTAGVRWGFRTNTNGFVMAHGTPFSHGPISIALGYPYVDNWAETKTLTIEFAVEGFAAGGQIPPGTILFGVDDQQANANNFPWKCYIDGNSQIHIDWVTQAVRFGPTQTYSLSIPQAKAGGVQRVTLQIDLTGPSATGWVNGVQGSAGTAGMTSGACFRENEDYPFQIAGFGTSDSFGATFADFAIYGLSISTTLRYRIGVVGSTQVRALDGAAYTAVKDKYRYSDDTTDRGPSNGGKTGIISYFAFLENPGALSPQLAIVCGASGNFATTAYLGLGNNIQTNFGGVKNLSVRNLNLLYDRPYSTPLMIGQVLNLSLVDVNSQGGLWALATLPVGSVYPIIGDRCTFSSTGDAAIYLYFAIATFRDTMIQNGGRANVRIRMSNLVMDGLFIAGANANCQFSVLRSHMGSSGGGQVSVRHVIQDVEGAPFPSRAAIGLERGPVGGLYRFVDVQAGRAPGKPALWLDSAFGAQPTWPANGVTTDNLVAFLSSEPAVTTGVGWTVNGVAAPVPVPTPVNPPSATQAGKTRSRQ
jgi:hypothetical protein